MSLRVLLLGALVGCKVTKDGDVPPTPSIEIGTGEAAFEALDPMGELLIVQGPQGGYHFNGSLHAIGVNPGNPDDLGDPENPTIAFTASAGGQRRDIGIEYTQGLRGGAAPHTYELLGRRVILDIATDAALDGDEIEFEVSISDADGNVLTDTRTVIAEPHPLNGTGF